MLIFSLPIYPYSCNPKDMLEAEIAGRMRFFFPDVQVRGYYIAPISNSGLMSLPILTALALAMSSLCAT
jgi:beta-glucosidase/6-phospho-beta-glucosidase/beta-galactosidase